MAIPESVTISRAGGQIRQVLTDVQDGHRLVRGPLRRQAEGGGAEAALLEDIQSEEDVLRLDEGQRAKLAENVDLAKRSIREGVWQAYNMTVLLGKDNGLKVVDMGLLHSSSADSLPGLVLKHMTHAGDVEKGVSPNFLVRKWPGFVEWSTKSVRDAFYASPLFPHLLNAEGGEGNHRARRVRGAAGVRRKEGPRPVRADRLQEGDAVVGRGDQ